MSKHAYSYCFLRYHHDPISGEFGNVGVLLWAPGIQFLGFRGCKKFRRLSQFFGKFASDDFPNLIKRLETNFSKLAKEYADQAYLPEVIQEPKSARDLALMIIPEDDGAIRWSPSQGGLSENPEKELDSIFQLLISSKNESSVTSRSDDKAIFDKLYKKAFSQDEVKPFIHSHLVKAQLATHEFAQAWKNGVWNVYEPLSFDYTDAERIDIKAFRWDSMTRHLMESVPPPNIHLLLGKAKDEHQRHYDKAKDILWSSRKVTLIEEDEADDFAEDLKSKILATNG